MDGTLRGPSIDTQSSGSAIYFLRRDSSVRTGVWSIGGFCGVFSMTVQRL